MNDVLQKALMDIGAKSIITSASEKFLLRSISDKIPDSIKEDQPQRLCRLGFVYELEGIKEYIKWLNEGSIRVQQPISIQEAKYNTQTYAERVGPTFGLAFGCWRALVNIDGEKSKINEVNLDIIRDDIANEEISLEHSLALHLAVCGILSQRTAEIRLVLRKWDFNELDFNDNWRRIVLKSIVEAFVLLTRKSNGWGDIDKSLQHIALLRNLQNNKEEVYIKGKGGDNEQINAAIDLVGLYHLAQLINLTAEYIQEGKLGISLLNTRLDRHHERGIAALKASNSSFMQHIMDMLWIGCREMAQNSIWTHAAILPPNVHEFIGLLASRTKLNPIIELWPAQQEALARNVLTTYHRAILVEMPTSAGKTLLAKFAIIQTKALNPDGTIAYIVPTRALVNQITLDLRSDFKGLKSPLKIEMTIPAFELDPTEEILLQNPPDVLVTTPEKLDLLIRKGHPVVENLSMIIADEAHNIREKGRGPRLELLLGTLKRDKPKARFLLLSPFMPNAIDILTWLGEGLALPAINVNWKPGNRIVGAIDITGRRPNRHLVFQTLPAADNSDTKERWKLPLSSKCDASADKTIKGLTLDAIEVFGSRGSILVLCRGKTTATTRAKEIADQMEVIPEIPMLKATCSYIRAEAGTDTPLIHCLKRGVAYHHAGISHETRWLLENLIKNGIVKIVCGTTTLAQGVNFPISTVIVETLDKGDAALSYEDFWNIAGRAGRTLMDSVGIVGFPINDKKRLDKIEQFLQGEAEEIASQLASIIDRADDIGTQFNMEIIYKNPDLSALLQFLAHAMRVSGKKEIADKIDEVEDIINASLVYRQVKARNGDAASKLLHLCRAYLNDLSKKKNVMGFLALADMTGFSTPSVLGIYGKLSESEYSNLRNTSLWEPKNLFDYGSKNLTRQMEVLGNIPEIKLGQGKTPPFDPNRVSNILKAWVNGVPINAISEMYQISDQENAEKRLTEFSEYLFRLIGISSWGIGALEGLCLSNASEEEWNKVGYVPSMVFYGVKQKEAVWLRMIGVPRVLADSMAELWKKKNIPSPQSYDEIRDWVNKLSDEDWKKTIPKEAHFTPDDCRILWDILRG